EDVLAERAQQIFEQLYFEIEPPDRVRQRREDQRGITAVLLDAAFGRLAQSPLPDFERRDALGIAAAALVGKVVGGARKRVDGGNVRPCRTGHQARGDRKVLVVRGRQTDARSVGGVGHHSVSETPALALTARAITKSRSESRLR